MLWMMAASAAAAAGYSSVTRLQGARVLDTMLRGFPLKP